MRQLVLVFRTRPLEDTKKTLFQALLIRPIIFLFVAPFQDAHFTRADRFVYQAWIINIKTRLDDPRPTPRSTHSVYVYAL